MGEDGRTFLRGIGSETYGLKEFRARQRSTARGTSVTLHLREGEDEFLSAWKLKAIIGKYSDHISLPILMQKEEWDAEAAK